MDSKRTGGFLKGVLLGALAGITAGVLFAPKAGEETRKELKKKAGEISKQLEKMYKSAKVSLDKKVVELKKAGKTIDKERYSQLVDEVVVELKKEGQVAKEAGQKLKAELKKDWAKVEKGLRA